MRGLSLLDSAFVSALASVNPVVTAWAARVVSNGGAAPSAGTVTAMNRFYNALVAAGLDSKLYAVNCFAPDSLTAALTPLIKTAGSALWTNHGFVLGDLTKDGLKGDAASKYLDTTVIPSSYASNSSGSLIFYVSDNIADRGEVEIGYANAGKFHRLYIYNGQPSFTCFDNDIQGTSSKWRGYVCGSRNASNVRNIYLGNSSTAHYSLTNDAHTEAGNAIPTSSLIAFASNEGGSVNNWTFKRLSFMAMGLGLSATESSSLFNAVQQLRTDLGGGADNNSTATTLPNAPQITDASVGGISDDGDGFTDYTLNWSSLGLAGGAVNVKGYYFEPADGGSWNDAGATGDEEDLTITITAPISATKLKVTTLGNTGPMTYDPNHETDSNIITL